MTRLDIDKTEIVFIKSDWLRSIPKNWKKRSSDARLTRSMIIFDCVWVRATTRVVRRIFCLFQCLRLLDDESNFKNYFCPSRVGPRRLV